MRDYGEIETAELRGVVLPHLLQLLRIPAQLHPAATPLHKTFRTCMIMFGILIWNDSANLSLCQPDGFGFQVVRAEEQQGPVP